MTRQSRNNRKVVPPEAEKNKRLLTTQYSQELQREWQIYLHREVRLTFLLLPEETIRYTR